MSELRNNLDRLMRVLESLFESPVPGVGDGGAPAVIGWTPSELEGPELIAAVDDADPGLRWLNWPEPFEAFVYRGWGSLFERLAEEVRLAAEAQRQAEGRR